MQKLSDDKNLVRQIAIVCHEANRAYCKTIGDDSQPPWDKAPDWQVESAIKGVEFHLNDPKASPAASHNSWLKEKETAGWKYGEKKDPEKKEHPCFVPYDQLPVEQKIKDYIFRATVHAFADAIIDDKQSKITNFTNAAPTLGQMRVRTSFNVTKSDKVGLIKDKTAELIDLVEEVKKDTIGRTDKNDQWKGETIRTLALAQTEYESAGHWAVKGATADK